MATEAQRRARDKWNKKNREKASLYRYRSEARKFIKEMATEKDIAEFKDLLDQREQELNS